MAFAPESAQRSRLESAESLVREIEADRAYPLEFVIFRLTGYRPDATADEQIVGSALRGDLVSMIQIASRRCPLPWDGPRGRPLDLEAVAARLGRRPGSLRSLRRRGLVFWWTHPPGRAPRLGCPPDMLAWFSRHVERSEVDRIDAAMRDRIVAAATAVGPKEDLASIVRPVSAQLDVSEDLVRGVLRRASDRGDAALPRARRLQRRDGRLAMRALRQGVPVADIARRLGVGVPSVHRSLRRERLALLQRTMARPCMRVDPDQTPLPVDASAPPLRWDSAFIPGTDREPPSRGQVEALAGSIVSVRTAMGETDPRSTEDRWAHLDAAMMAMTRCWWDVLLGLGTAIDAALRGWAKRPTSEIPPPVLTRVLGPLLELAVTTLQRATLDDASRLADRTRAAADRLLIDPRATPPERAGQETVGVFLLRHTPWRLLLPDPRWERAVVHLDEADADLAGRRFALAGRAMRSAAQCAADLGCTVQAVAARVGWLRRRLHDLARGEGGEGEEAQ